MSNACAACPAGSTNAAGDDATGADTTCDATLCGANQRVSSNACVACAAGSTNAAGDDATGSDTTCDVVLCTGNRRVVNHACVACQGSFGRDPGDDPTGPDTACTQTYTMFVTSTLQNAALGGVPGADALCQGQATAAGLSGIYLALLSGGGTDAISRVANGTYPIRRPDGIRLADNRAAMFSGGLLASPAFDATGAAVNTGGFAGNVMTGSSAAGVATAYTCGGWTVGVDNVEPAPYVGDLESFSTSNWLSAGISACSIPQRIYCVGR